MNLADKIEIAESLIVQWYDFYKGQVYICFSGGKDSTVLLDIARSLYPNIPAVFCNTGQEFPEIIRFVRSYEDITWIKPKITYQQVLRQYGFPVVTKSTSMAIDRYVNTKDPVQKELRLNGGINPTSGKVQKTGKIPKCWKYLLKAPFKISERCCYFLKKEPFFRYQNKTGRKPIIGTMSSESLSRQLSAIQNGCNGFKMKKPQSRPLTKWTENDILEYIQMKNLLICPIYKTEKRTGCMGCGFGLHKEKTPNRFERMEKSHPRRYRYYMKIGWSEVIKWLKFKR